MPEPKEKAIWIRARCTAVLKKRMADYLASETDKGNSKKESEVLREIVVEFLDRVAPQEDKDASPARKKANSAKDDATLEDQIVQAEGLVTRRKRAVRRQ